MREMCVCWGERGLLIGDSSELSLILTCVGLVLTRGLVVTHLAGPFRGGF